MSKNIQMPVEFLNEVAGLLKSLESENISEDSRDICRRIETLLIDKLERIEKRKAFTDYKTSLDGEARERARKEYLDKAQISKSFVSDEEISYFNEIRTKEDNT